MKCPSLFSEKKKKKKKKQEEEEYNFQDNDLNLQQSNNIGGACALRSQNSDQIFIARVTYP